MGWADLVRIRLLQPALARGELVLEELEDAPREIRRHALPEGGGAVGAQRPRGGAAARGVVTLKTR